MTRILVCLLAALLAAAAASAQSVDITGVRAQGMGGAFTAVADDASATWWNPAGLAGGAFFNAILEVDRADQPTGTTPPTTPSSVNAFSLAVPSLGVSYYHFRVSEMQAAPATGGGGPSRQDVGAIAADLLVASQFGVTVGQSLGDHLVIATTLKLLHGGPDSGTATTAGSLDAGALARFGRTRLGLSVRNLTQPTLGGLTLERQARAGVAFELAGRGPVDAVTLAADADLTTSHELAGEARAVAAGAEVWLAKRRIGLRGGGSVETVGATRAAASGGASLSVRSGLFLEGTITGGSDLLRRGWAADLRVTF